MNLPVYVYGWPLLRKVADDIDQNYEGLKQFIEDMWETMYKSDGIGLAAPQVGKTIRLFVIDGTVLAEDDPQMEGFKQVFINARITEQFDDEWVYQEGCLSLPGIREEVSRPGKLKIQYYDDNWNFHDEEFEGLKARIIQHEYDHLQGILFIDKISPIRRRLLNSRLANITKGKAEVSYKIKIPK